MVRFQRHLISPSATRLHPITHLPPGQSTLILFELDADASRHLNPGGCARLGRGLELTIDRQPVHERGIAWAALRDIVR
jgi:hypothetical protein